MGLPRALLAAAVLLSGQALASGSIRGVAAFSGPAALAVPDGPSRKSDPFCAKRPFRDESILLSPNGAALQNVVVRIIKGAPPLAVRPQQPVVIDQRDCLIRPRISAAVRGQPILFRNSDGTMHAPRGHAGPKPVFNLVQPPKAKDAEKTAKVDGDVLRLQCDVHPWMQGYVVTSENGFFAVTGEDGGFSLDAVPPGSYTVEAWHEKLGRQTVELTVVEGQPAVANFAFSNEG